MAENPSYDLFVSHALEDQISLTQPLVEALRAKGIRLWYSSENLQIGDTLSSEVNQAIRQSRYCLAIISPAFLDSWWMQQELDAFVALETDHRKRILPIWHQLTYEDVKDHLPLHAGRFALSSERSLEELVNEIEAVIKGKQPLRIGRTKPFWQKPWTQQRKRMGLFAGVASIIGVGFLGKTVINHVQGNQINVSGTENTVILNPSETQQKQKQFEGAFQLVTAEILENAGQSSALMMTMPSPEPFWRTRFPNESPSEFSVQALQHHASYQQAIAQKLQATSIRQDAYRPNATILMHDEKVGSAVRSIYRAFEAWEGVLQDYAEGLVLHQTMNSWSESERSDRNQALFAEKFRKAQIELLQVAGQACWVFESEVSFFQESLALAGIEVELKPGKEGFQRCAELSAQLYQQIQEGAAFEKAPVPGLPIPPIGQSSINRSRKITDPAMLLRRKQMGRPDTLTEAELIAMEYKTLDTTLTDPSELLLMAGMSFLEFDGRASEFYLRQALNQPSLGSLQRTYLRQSIHRLQYPEKYQGGLGIWVMEVEESGGFSAAGITSGDVIIAVTGQAVDQVLEINQALARLDVSEVEMEILREDRLLRKSVPTRSAGAKMSQLIMWDLVGG
ncbi:MAG: TIR domain-containing protein [Bacteroidota bacterium]